ncbi:hypothetical protein PI124_g20794 [Phytophthora idaei]|nr:hypothetical protein PI125_g22265 [Phytophthora idaei]KAG3128191.1 hypothetical protein PI126_g21506 [Phytophthora idaei]KAG3234149.1 hypothetical protein PI124_g20794 [Phytophthora idaei]
MARQVIGPTLRRTSGDFPRLNGSNFAGWNARVRAAFDGKGLLGFIDQEDFDGDSDSSLSASDEVKPGPPSPQAPPSPMPSEALLGSDTGTLAPISSLDEGDAAERKTDASSSESASDSSSATHLTRSRMVPSPPARQRRYQRPS